MKTMLRESCWHFSHKLECPNCNEEPEFHPVDELDASFRNRIQGLPNVLSFRCGHSKEESEQTEGETTKQLCISCELKGVLK